MSTTKPQLVKLSMARVRGHKSHAEEEQQELDRIKAKLCRGMLPEEIEMVEHAIDMLGSAIKVKLARKTVEILRSDSISGVDKNVWTEHTRSNHEN